MPQAFTMKSVKRVRTTADAFLLAIEDDGWEEHWVPKSLLGEGAFDAEGGEVEIADWWLANNGIEEE